MDKYIIETIIINSILTGLSLVLYFAINLKNKAYYDLRSAFTNLKVFIDLCYSNFKLFFQLRKPHRSEIFLGEFAGHNWFQKTKIYKQC